MNYLSSWLYENVLLNHVKSSQILYYLHFHGLPSGNFTFQKNVILKYSNDMCYSNFILFNMFSCAGFPEVRHLINI